MTWRKRRECPPHSFAAESRQSMNGQSLGQTRSEIFGLIKACHYRIQGLSRSVRNPLHQLKCLNKPLNLGFFMGAKDYEAAVKAALAERRGLKTLDDCARDNCEWDIPLGRQSGQSASRPS